MKEVKNQLQKEPTLKGSRVWGILLLTVLLLIDQLTKLFADAYFSSSGAPHSIDIIPGWLSLCITYNRGISYGLGDSAPVAVKLLVILGTAVVMTALAVLYWKVDKRRTLLRLALVFIVAGGVGNLIDRLYYRVWDPSTLYGVRDMVDLSRFGFAVCNFADFFITGGAVMLVLALLFFDSEAMFPIGKKYKALAKESEERSKKKAAEKAKAKAQSVETQEQTKDEKGGE